MLPVVSCADEISEVLAWSMKNPEARQRAADGARVAVADRTFEANARTLLGQFV